VLLRGRLLWVGQELRADLFVIPFKSLLIKGSDLVDDGNLLHHFVTRIKAEKLGGLYHVLVRAVDSLGMTEHPVLPYMSVSLVTSISTPSTYAVCPMQATERKGSLRKSSPLFWSCACWHCMLRTPIMDCKHHGEVGRQRRENDRYSRPIQEVKPIIVSLHLFQDTWA
jgi:hypothetical protein